MRKKTDKQIAQEAEIFQAVDENIQNPGQVRREQMQAERLRKQVVDMSEAAKTQRLHRIEEFAKHMPYTMADAKAELGPDLDQNMYLALWAGQRWLMAQAMVDYMPDLSVNLRTSE